MSHAQHTLYNHRQLNDDLLIQNSQIDDIKDAFQLFIADQHKTKLKASELLAVFIKLKLSETQPSVTAMLQHIVVTLEDPDLTFQEFIRHCNDYYNQRSTSEGIQRIFQLLDPSNNGYLTRDDISEIGAQYDIYLQPDMIDLIFQRASADGDLITFLDFEHFMKVNI